MCKETLATNTLRSEWIGKENCYFDCKAYRNLCFSSNDIPKIEEIFKQKLTEASDKDDDLNSHPKVKEFREKVWNIHHQGQPMPTANTQQGLEDEDIIMSQVRKQCMRNKPWQDDNQSFCPIAFSPYVSSPGLKVQRKTCLKFLFL